MIKKIFLGCTLFATGLISNAQYYYKDIVSNKQLLSEMANLKGQKIKTVNVTSFEDDGKPSDGFFCQKNINRNYTQVEMLTKSNVTGASIFISILARQRQAFLMQVICGSVIAFIVCSICQVVERLGGASLISQSSEQGQTLPAESARFVIVALCHRHCSHDIQ